MMRLDLSQTTILAMWLGYQMNWIQQRRAFLAKLQKPDGVSDYHPTFAPHGLWLLGEQGHSVIWLYHQSLRDEARPLFPESSFFPPIHPSDNGRQFWW